MWQQGRDRNRGTSLTGYGLIVGLISIVALASVTNIGANVVQLFDTVSTATDITGNRAPSWSTAADLGNHPAGAPLSITLAAADPEGGAVSFALTDAGTLPNELSFDAQTATLSGTPASDGTFAFTVTATDPDGQSSPREFTVTIAGLAAASQWAFHARDCPGTWIDLDTPDSAVFTSDNASGSPISGVSVTYEGTGWNFLTNRAYYQCTSGTTDQRVVFTLPGPGVIGSMRLNTVSTGFETRFADDFAIQRYNGSTWEDVDVRTNTGLASGPPDDKLILNIE